MHFQTRPNIAEKLKSCEEKINKEFAHTEEFQDLAEDIISKAVETRQKEKLEALKSMFLNTILSDHPNYDEAMEITSIIDGWQPRHIILMKILSNPRKADQNMGGVVGNGGGFSTSLGSIIGQLLPKWNLDEIDRIWQDLYSQKIHRTPGINTMMNDLGIRQLENRLTDFGKKIVSYLESPI